MMFLKFNNGSARKLKLVLPNPFRSVKPMIVVNRIGYRWKIAYATINGMLNKYPYFA